MRRLHVELEDRAAADLTTLEGADTLYLATDPDRSMSVEHAFFGNPDIVSVRSTDGGDNWSAPVRVNDDVGTTAQFFPWIVGDGNGGTRTNWLAIITQLL